MAFSAAHEKVLARLQRSAHLPAEAFEDLLVLVQQRFEAPVVMVSLRDGDTVRHVACRGTALSQMPLAEALSADVLATGAPLVVPDVHAVARWEGHPLVTGPEARLQSYAAVPLREPGGLAVGALGVGGRMPTVTEEGVGELQRFARLAMAVIVQHYMYHQAADRFQRDPQPLLLCTPDARNVLEVNPAFARWIGYTGDEDAVPSLQRLLPSASYKAFTAAATAASSATRETGPLALRQPGGQRVQARVTLHPMLWRGQWVYVCVWSPIDPDPEALVPRQHADTLLHVIDQAPIPMQLTDQATGQILHVNTRFANTFGVDPGALDGVHTQDHFVDPSRRDKMLEHLRAKGQVNRFDFEARHLAGHTLWIRASITPVTFRQRPALLSALQDITDQKQYEADLIAQRRRAEEQVRARTSLFNSMSHELRTPLTSIIGFADLLAAETVDDEQRDVAALIRNSGQRLLHSINEVMDWARLEAGQEQPSLAPTAIDAQVREVVRMLQPAASDKGLHLESAVPDGLSITTDAFLLGRVLINLTNNAIKFTEAGGVTVRAVAAAAGVQLSVEDTGRGIPAGFLPFLFDEFTQATPDDNQQGSGLGLSITRRLVMLLEGTIHVKTAEGVGTRFDVYLPDAAAPST
ncbi:MAG: PAS domain S-box protein [Bacteroidetes bacterium]|jgi:PAS domain S-box-containing protein|nr:PAS domain S-box protein [Bacteroidota bacterium]